MTSSSTPPVTTPVTPPVTTPVTPPVTTPVTPPVTTPVTPPVTTPVTPPATTLPQVSITGASQVRLGSTLQLTADVTGTSNTLVTWQVNGVSGGTTDSGFISASGLYTPPLNLLLSGGVSISAITQATPAATATQLVSILNPLPLVTSVNVIQGSSLGSYVLDIVGSGFVSASQISVDGAPVATTFLDAGELKSALSDDPGLLSLAVSVVNPDPGGSTSAAIQVSVVGASLSAATRLLDQASFGPTLSDIQHVRTIGIASYLSEQFATPAIPLTLSGVPVCANSVGSCLQSGWWQAALTGKDQLRERVAFALSEIFVVSTRTIYPEAAMAYQNILTADAFSNFNVLMRDITLSTAMGAYLNVLDSGKPINGLIANENYARELMQLFTTGLYVLQPDGTPDPSLAPVYTEAQVQAFARAYTGWTYAAAGGGTPARFPNTAANFESPMAAVESEHDTSAKSLLLGVTLPAGQTAEEDLTGALANLFNHPNVGPFVSRQLIQHLVTSSPSSAYVGRVAAVFADNGQGVRGDMKAIITAILTDPEARAGDIDASTDDGHLRETLLYMAGVMRGLGFVNSDPIGDYTSASRYSILLGQVPFQAPSVFNFFPPDYVIPSTTLNAPEFGQENTSTATLRLTLAEDLVSNRIKSFTVDLSATSPLGTIASQTGNALNDSGSLADALGILFLHGQMPAEMRSAIVNHLSTLSDIGQRVRVATYLVITSSLYKIEH